MTKTAAGRAETESHSASQAITRVLVVDDSKVQRKILSASLGRWGFEVMQAASGEEALALCRMHRIDMVLSDWMMPGMSGLDLCRAFRGLGSDDYGYFILLTSKSGKCEIAEGLDGGADDFLTKPVNGGELRARIAAGERILRMQRELKEKNRLIGQTLDDMHALNRLMDRDLIEARKLQQSLLRERSRDFGPASVSLLLRPCGHVGGDLVGVFPIDRRHIGVFGIDVSGHGIASALMTARLAGFLSASSPGQNVALIKGADGGYRGRAPAEVAARLNALTLEEMDTENYFTLIYGEVELTTGKVRMVQAGHPSPAVQRSGGRVEFVGDGGMPVGLLATAQFEEFEFYLGPGDRLLLYSDGVTECATSRRGMVEETGLVDIMNRNRGVRGVAMLEAMVWDLGERACDSEFADDISAVLVEFHGPGPRGDSD